jgi:aryl-alcohol dehydrogenase-like predicted oxidoreductase
MKYHPLGRSGLLVSQLALGTMTFANPAWGSDDATAEAILHAYMEGGGNFIDTADVYGGGNSERLVGRLITEGSLRDRVVLSSKFGFCAERGNPNAAGNGRKNIYRALEGTLSRLNTDYLDLYYLHVWDQLTPAQELLDTFTALVTEGKIRYYGLSDLPAWYATQVCTLAHAQAKPAPIVMQMEYSLVDRTAEYEHIPAGRALGMALSPWSPLAAGFLSGKYKQGETPTSAVGEGRLAGPNPFGNTKFTQKNWDILAALEALAKETGQTISQLALAWLLARPGVVAPVIGARSLSQLSQNMASAAIRLAPDTIEALNNVSTPTTPNQFGSSSLAMQKIVFAGSEIASQG